MNSYVLQCNLAHVVRIRGDLHDPGTWHPIREKRIAPCENDPSPVYVPQEGLSGRLGHFRC
jgi:hypothetical protein